MPVPVRPRFRVHFREEFSFLSFFCCYVRVWTTTTLSLCCRLCHIACKPANATNNITWLCHCPHSISASKSLCSLNGGCRVFAHHARKNHSDDSKLSFDPGSEYTLERNFRSSLFLLICESVDNNYVVFAL